jgi:hypothetical protein
MTTIALLLALVALALFLLEFFAVVRRSVLALGLAFLTASWVWNLMSSAPHHHFS